MLAGLAPIANDSGDRAGTRSIKGGRAGLRTGIYMAAVSAASSNPGLMAFYDRLVAAASCPRSLSPPSCASSSFLQIL